MSKVEETVEVSILSTGSLLIALTRNLNLLLLSLWGRYFFHVNPGHSGPACLSISRFLTGTFADPESNTHCAFVDFLTNSFKMTYAMQIL